MANELDKEVEIDLGELFKILLKHWKTIILSCVSTSILAILITVFLIPKQYESRISLYVNNNQTIGESIELSDINASKSLVNTYMALLKSDCVLDKVVNRIQNEEYDLEKVRDIISCNQVNATEIFEVIVKTPNPELSTDIAAYIGEIAPKEISRVFKSGSVEIVDTAKIPEKESSPSKKLNIAIGGIIGLIVSCCTVIIVNMMNQKINEPKDFENKYNVPLLGIIPDRLKK